MTTRVVARSSESGRASLRGVAGLVREATTGRPIAGAWIAWRLPPWSLVDELLRDPDIREIGEGMVTDAAGRFAVERLPDGLHVEDTIYVVARGYAAASKRVGLVREVVIDLENFSEGRHAPDVPRLDPPLRLTVETPNGLQALRVPLLNPRGQHVFGLPEPTSAFDNPTFLVHMVAKFFASRGRELKSDACMATESCAWMPPPSPPTP